MTTDGVLAALITGPFTAIVTYWLLSEDWRQRSPLGQARRNALKGAWAGRIDQEVGVNVDGRGDNLQMTLRCGWRTVHGTGPYLLRVA